VVHRDGVHRVGCAKLLFFQTPPLGESRSGLALDAVDANGVVRRCRVVKVHLHNGSTLRLLSGSITSIENTVTITSALHMVLGGGGGGAERTELCLLWIGLKLLSLRQFDLDTHLFLMAVIWQ
jgi:hypothetical protein